MKKIQEYLLSIGCSENQGNYIKGNYVFEVNKSGVHVYSGVPFQKRAEWLTRYYLIEDIECIVIGYCVKKGLDNANSNNHD